MSRNLPTIALVTPNRNQASFLDATIKSVVTQCYPHLEYFVLDGASTDNSVEVIETHAQNVTGWKSEPDAGQYDAVNKGFEMSKGEVMGWINSDDVLHPKSLFLVGQIFRDHPEIQWLMGRSTHVNERGSTVFCANRERWSKYRFFDGRYRWIQQESTFWRRSLWEAAGGQLSLEYPLAADLELWSRFFQHADLYTIDGLIGAFRVRSSGQRSQTMAVQYQQEAEEILGRARVKLPSADRHRLATICLMRRTVMALPVLRGLLKRPYERLHRYPRRLEFDPESQSMQFVGTR